MRRRSLAFSGLALAATGGLLGPGCSATPTAQAVRALEGSDQMTFVCLGAPNAANIFHEVGDCTTQLAASVADFGVTVETPHLYALINQTIQGSVAMVDLATMDPNVAVLDADPSTPGAAFFPVGANPISIVATPKGTAAFVATDDNAEPALFVLPLNHLRPCEVDSSQCNKPAPTLSSWPACALPSSPGQMVVVADPADPIGQVRPTCGGTYAPPEASNGRGSIDEEGRGREKLIVALPKKGELVVIDAQTLLDGTPGAVLTPCPIEETIVLSGAIPVVPPVPPPPPGPACVVPPGNPSGLLGPFKPVPDNLAYADGRLYVADIGAPLIHVLDVSSPCNPAELPPLVPTSVDDPMHPVKTTSLAVTPLLTPGDKRYLYGVDARNRSVMVFDVSASATSQTPLLNPNPTWNPLQPPDRFQFSGTPAAVAMMSRDQPAADLNMVAPFGTLCDPNPSAVVCTGTNVCDLGTTYRTKSDYSAGAGPTVLRGTFGLIGLPSGAIDIMDIQDFDEPCRGPATPGSLLGCTSSFAGGITSAEGTCGAVVTNTPRSLNYIVSNTYVGNHLPGITGFPILTTLDGNVLDPSKVSAARMRATTPSSMQPMPVGPPSSISVNGNPVNIDSNGLASNSPTDSDTVLMNLEDPHVQVVDQQWTVRYEGPLPGFVGKRADLQLLNGQRNLTDSASQFCAAGVQSQASIGAILVSEKDPDPVGNSLKLADRVSITDPLLDPTQGYWENAACTYQNCESVFGDDTTPTPQRDIVITEAFDDHLELGDPPAGADLTHCCFPLSVGYAIRPGGQWVVTGNQNGFFHHVIPDPTTGVCRDSCDPNKVRLNGRARTVAGTAPVADGMPGSFINPMFRFVVTYDPTAMDGLPLAPPLRDMQFTFATEGSFVPLKMDLTVPSTRNFVEVQSVAYLQSFDSFVVTDGGLEGLLVVPAGGLGGTATPKQIF